MQNTRISISKGDLEAAAKQGSMSPLDVEPLWQALSQSQTINPPSASPEASRFDSAQLAWYAGGVLVMIAMGWFMSRAEEVFGMNGVLGLSLLYTAGFAGLGWKLLKDGVRTPAGVLYTLAVLMTPVTLTSALTVMHMESFLGSNAGALTLELATAAVGLFALLRGKTSLLSAPVYGSFWAISMTAAWIITSGSGGFSGFFDHFDHYNFVSMAIGLVILASAVHVDTRFGRVKGADYSYWGYVFGTAAFWIHMSFLDSGCELGKFIYFGVNIVLMLASVILARRVLLLAGAVGAVGYIGHVIWTYFSNSLTFPVLLIAAGLGVIYLGNKYRTNQASIDAFVLSLVPQSVQKMLPKRG